jgi:hypothetical protein
MDLDMPLADIAKKLKKDGKNKNKKGAKPGKKNQAANNKQGKGNTPKKGTPNKQVKGGVGKVHESSFLPVPAPLPRCSCFRSL